MKYQHVALCALMSLLLHSAAARAQESNKPYLNADDSYLAPSKAAPVEEVEDSYLAKHNDETAYQPTAVNVEEAGYAYSSDDIKNNDDEYKPIETYASKGDETDGEYKPIETYASKGDETDDKYKPIETYSSKGDETDDKYKPIETYSSKGDETDDKYKPIETYSSKGDETDDKYKPTETYASKGDETDGEYKPTETYSSEGDEKDHEYKPNDVVVTEKAGEAYLPTYNEDDEFTQNNYSGDEDDEVYTDNEDKEVDDDSTEESSTSRKSGKNIVRIRGSRMTSYRSAVEDIQGTENLKKLCDDWESLRQLKQRDAVSFMINSRHFLMKLEDMLGQAVPYWDFSASSSLPSEFVDESYGTDKIGNKKYNPLRFGKLSHDAKREKTKRGSNHVQLDRAQIRGTIKYALTLDTFEDFSNAIETCINNLNFAIGGDFITHDVITYDPLFWSILSYTDHVWSRWQMRYADAAYPKLDKKFSADDEMEYADIIAKPYKLNKFKEFMHKHFTPKNRHVILQLSGEESCDDALIYKVQCVNSDIATFYSTTFPRGGDADVSFHRSLDVSYAMEDRLNNISPMRLNKGGVCTVTVSDDAKSTTHELPPKTYNLEFRWFKY